MPESVRRPVVVRHPRRGEHAGVPFLFGPACLLLSSASRGYMLGIAPVPSRCSGSRSLQQFAMRLPLALLVPSRRV